MGTSSDPDSALAGPGTAADYFSSLLGAGDGGRPQAAAPSRRATVVTPATIARVREQQAEDALAAERAAAARREAALAEEVEAQKAACESLAADLVSIRQELEEERGRPRLDEAAQAEMARLRQEGAAMAAEVASLKASLAAGRDEAARLSALLEEAQRTSLSSSVLLEKPPAFSEKFAGETREHVLDALAQAYRDSEACGRDRRARILEAVLAANPPSGELERRREAVRQIVKDAGQRLDDSAIEDLVRLGFRYVSGNKHHKLDWAGVRFPLAKTPSDFRACMNSAAEIVNRVF